MGKTIPISLLCLLFTVAHGQDTCNRTAFHPIEVLSNPNFANTAVPCRSGFTPFFSWYTTNDEIPTGFLNSCTNYTISDSTFYNHSFSQPNICFFPMVPPAVPESQGIAVVSDFGYEGDVHVYYGHKSYVSTCLTAPLQKDSLYRLDFYAGFGGVTRDAPLPVHNGVLVPQYSASPETFGLFGLGDCSSLATPAPLIGCPAVNGWLSLGSITVISDTGVWNKVSITFRAPRDISAIALGPSCDSAYRSSKDNKSYSYQGETIIADQFSYFLTGLQFYQSTAPPPVVSLVSGDSCTAAVVLQVQPANYYQGSSFQWFRNDTTISGQSGGMITVPHTTAHSADYRCRVQNDSLCLVSDAFPVNWSAIPSALALGSADTTACTGDSLVLRVAGDPSFHYRWGNGSTLSYLVVSQPGTSVVTISNDCGTATAQKTVNFGKCDLNVYVPNGFTPNGDGHNDLLHAHFFYPPARFSMHIFNRNGVEVFASANPLFGWDGNYNGRPQPAGVYIWAVDYKDFKGGAHALRGTAVLIR